MEVWRYDSTPPDGHGDRDDVNLWPPPRLPCTGCAISTGPWGERGGWTIRVQLPRDPSFRLIHTKPDRAGVTRTLFDCCFTTYLPVGKPVSDKINKAIWLPPSHCGIRLHPRPPSQSRHEVLITTPLPLFPKSLVLIQLHSLPPPSPPPPPFNPPRLSRSLYVQETPVSGNGR